ncbi:MAG: hypothetical protein HDT23_08905 [Ruminococcus sp.]|nr:hypothetical protein [Ruminococcus sp.]
MNLEETKQNWNISEKTLISWIDNGFIPDIEIENGRISIGNLKPYVIKRGTHINNESVCRYILRACNEFHYIDYNILNIERHYFVDIMTELERNNYIRRNLLSDDYSSNRNFIITEYGGNFLKKRKFNLENLNFNIQFNI